MRADDMNRLARFKQAQKYALYYGTGREGELARFDLVVVDPGGQSDQAVRLLRETGTLVLSYLSVMEIPPFRPEIKLLKNTDLLTENGSLLLNPEYGNYLADLRSKRWLGLLFQQAGRLINQSGYDGLFLDTIGDVEWTRIPGELRDLLLLAAVKIVCELRLMFPGHILVQNGGLEKLCLLTSEYVNGICWENPPLTARASRAWTRTITERLAGLQDKYGLRVLLLLEAQDKTETGNDGTDQFRQAEMIAEQRGFLLYQAPFRYLNLP